MLKYFLNKLAGCKAVSLATLLKQTPTLMFSCEYSEISKNTYLEEHLRTAACELTLGSNCLRLSF